VIFHAALNAAHTFMVVLAYVGILYVAAVAVARVYTWAERRAERRRLAAIERERSLYRAQLRQHERHRSELRCVGGVRQTGAERWSGRAI
jgi:hypothetical protein